MNEVNSKSLRINWDPANIYFAESVPYPEQFFEHAKDLIGYGHLKDCVRMNSEHNKRRHRVVLGKLPINSGVYFARLTRYVFLSNVLRS